MALFCSYLRPCIPAYRNTEASALVFVMVLITLLSVVLGSIMGLYWVRDNFIRKDIHKTQARYIAEAGLYTVLNELSANPFLKSKDIQFQTGHAQIKVSPFGGFYLLSSLGRSHESRVLIHAMIGTLPDELWDSALVLGDVKSNFYAVQDTHIKGLVYGGSMRIESASLGFRPFTGSLETSYHALPNNRLPEFNPRLFKDTQKWLQNLERQPNEDFQDLTRLLNPTLWGQQTDQPFMFRLPLDAKLILPATWKPKRPIWLVGSGDVHISGEGTLPNGSIIISGRNLTLSGDLRLNHTVCQANNFLIVKEQVRGSAQLIAGRQASVQDKVYLEWPTMIYTSGEELGQSRFGDLMVTNQAQVDGLLILPKASIGIRNDQARIRILKPAKVRGGVFSTNQVEVDGTVFGTLMTHQFYFYESSSAYVNWIRNAHIIGGTRPPNWILPVGFEGQLPLALLSRWEAEMPK